MSKNGLILIKPTTVDKTGTGSTATISANGSVEFSSCTALSLNGVFSADYDNYMIVCRHDINSSVPDALFKLRNAGIDTTDNYTRQFVYASSTSIVGGRSTTTTPAIFTSSNTQKSGGIAWIYGPNLTQPTAVRSVGTSGYLDAFLIDSAITHSASSSYDGFSLINQSTYVASGRVAVYGMRK